VGAPRAIGAVESLAGPLPGVPDAARRGLTRLLPAAALLLLALVAFRGVAAGRVFYLRDAVQNHGPLRAYVAARLRSLEMPSWNPFHGAGTPLFANPNALVLHPTSLLFLALPDGAAFTAAVVLQYGLLMLGGYLLARAAGRRPAGAALAAVLIGLSGPAASLASLHNVLAAFAWVPLGVWALLRGTATGSGRFLALAGVCCAVVLMAAEPASLLAFLILAGTLLLTGDGRGGRTPPRRALAVLGFVLIAGGLLACVQILPAQALLPLTPRGPGFPPEEGLKWSLQPVRLLEMVLPRLFGDPTRLSPGAWWGRFLFEGGYPLLLSVYVGLAPLLLAGAALAERGAGEVRRRALGVAALCGILLALGGHAAIYRGLHAALPLLRQVRYPERFLLAGLVPLALLAAEGLDRLSEPGMRRRTLRLAVATGALLFAAASLLAAAPGIVDPGLARLARLPAAVLETEMGAGIRGALLTTCLWAFAEAALLAFGAGAAGRQGGAGDLAPWGLVAGAGLSVVLAASPALSTAAPGWIQAASPLSGSVGHGADAPRLHHEPRPADLSIWARTDEIIWGFRFDRFTYSLQTGLADRVPSVLDAATDRMDLRGQADLGRALPALPLPEQIKILRVVGAGFLLSYAPLHETGLAPGPVLEGFSRPPLRVYRVERTLPRVRFRTRAAAPGWPADPARSLADPRYDPERDVLIEDAAAPSGSAAPPGPPGGGEAGGPGPVGGDDVPITMLEDRPERVRLRLTAPRPGWVVLADAHAPGWRATLDGRPVELLRADGIFRAVAVGAGEHTIEMRYRVPGLMPGLVLGLLGAAGLAAAACSRGVPRGAAG
jgi:hypothetical protein